MYNFFVLLQNKMVVVAQLVRASECGSEGRGFETHLPPYKEKAAFSGGFFFIGRASRLISSFQFCYKTLYSHPI